MALYALAVSAGLLLTPCLHAAVVTNAITGSGNVTNGANLLTLGGVGAITFAGAGRANQTGGYTIYGDHSNGAYFELQQVNVTIDALTGGGSIANNQTGGVRTLTLGAANHASSVNNPYPRLRRPGSDQRRLRRHPSELRCRNQLRFHDRLDGALRDHR